MTSLQAGPRSRHTIRQCGDRGKRKLTVSRWRCEPARARRLAGEVLRV